MPKEEEEEVEGGGGGEGGERKKKTESYGGSSPRSLLCSVHGAGATACSAGKRRGGE